jgi:hypothetical protein
MGLALCLLEPEVHDCTADKEAAHKRIHKIKSPFVLSGQTAIRDYAEPYKEQARPESDCGAIPGEQAA